MRTWPLLVLVVLMVWVVQSSDAKDDKEEKDNDDSSDSLKDEIIKWWQTMKKAGKKVAAYILEKIKKYGAKAVEKFTNALKNKDDKSN